jgi:hypothetical protein
MTDTKAKTVKELLEKRFELWKTTQEMNKAIGKAKQSLTLCNRKRKVQEPQPEKKKKESWIDSEVVVAQQSLDKLQIEQEKHSEKLKESWDETQELLRPLITQSLEDLKVGSDVVIKVSKTSKERSPWAITKITGIDSVVKPGGNTSWMITFKNAYGKEDFLQFWNCETFESAIIVPLSIVDGDHDAVPNAIKALTGTLDPVVILGVNSFSK